MGAAASSSKKRCKDDNDEDGAAKVPRTERAADSERDDDNGDAVKGKEQKADEDPPTILQDALYQSLMSTKETRWCASELAESGAHQLAGRWTVYGSGSYHFIPDTNPGLAELYRMNNELVKPMSGTLELLAVSKSASAPRNMHHCCQDCGKETAANAVPLLEGTLVLDDPRLDAADAGW